MSDIFRNTKLFYRKGRKVYRKEVKKSLHSLRILGKLFG